MGAILSCFSNSLRWKGDVNYTGKSVSCLRKRGRCACHRQSTAVASADSRDNIHRKLLTQFLDSFCASVSFNLFGRDYLHLSFHCSVTFFLISWLSGNQVLNEVRSLSQVLLLPQSPLLLYLVLYHAVFVLNVVKEFVEFHSFLLLGLRIEEIPLLRFFFLCL